MGTPHSVPSPEPQILVSLHTPSPQWVSSHLFLLHPVACGAAAARSSLLLHRGRCLPSHTLPLLQHLGALSSTR